MSQNPVRLSLAIGRDALYARTLPLQMYAHSITLRTRNRVA
jgi:hypothetical protein